MARDAERDREGGGRRENQKRAPSEYRMPKIASEIKCTVCRCGKLLLLHQKQSASVRMSSVRGVYGAYRFEHTSYKTISFFLFCVNEEMLNESDVCSYLIVFFLFRVCIAKFKDIHRLTAILNALAVNWLERQSNSPTHFPNEDNPIKWISTGMCVRESERERVREREREIESDS